MKDRILEVIELLCDSNKSRFARELGVSPGNVGDWLSGRSEPKPKTLRRIYEKYKISPTWLILGIGDAFESLPLSRTHIPHIPPKLRINDTDSHYKKRKTDLDYDNMFRSLPEREQVGLVFKVIYEWSQDSKSVLYQTLGVLLNKINKEGK